MAKKKKKKKKTLTSVTAQKFVKNGAITEQQLSF